MLSMLYSHPSITDLCLAATAGVHAPAAQILPHTWASAAFEVLHHLPVRDRLLLAVHALRLHHRLQALPFSGRLLHHEQVNAPPADNTESTTVIMPWYVCLQRTVLILL